MNLDNIKIYRSITTTVSLPLTLYSQLLKQAQQENTSLSDIVRRALYKEFDDETNQEKA